MQNDSYEEKLASQIDQYRQVENIHDLPDIFHYWSNKHIRPRLNKVVKADSVTDFYVNPLNMSISESKSARRILSLGAGDCSVEIGVTKKMIELGSQEFEFICHEVSGHLLERAEKAIAKENLGKYMKLEQVDVNKWQPDVEYSGVMANHSLHHFVELESIFSGVYQCLEKGGVFVSNDMIGRNGHMRWPEVLEFVQSIWAFMPDKLKFNQQLSRFESEFINWDCSGEGFEGVRAQDILPLLLNCFEFRSFLAFGGIVDVFVDRAFGHNLDSESPVDRALIDFIQLLDDRLIDSGYIKPTTMFAVMTKQSNVSPLSWRHWTPNFCMRNTNIDI